jgi:NitT/TauT family transport system substrate-binding protein
VQLTLAGEQVTVFDIDDITPLPGPGLTVGEQTLASKKEAIRAFVAATLRAMADIAADPELGVEDSIAVVPELATNRDMQLAILEATIEMWSSPYTETNGTGAIDPGAWQQSLEFMRGLPDSNIPANLTVEQLISEEVLPD